MPSSSVYFSDSAWCLHIGVVVIGVLLLRSSFDISRIVLFAISHNMVFYCVFSLVVYSILLSSLFLSFSVTNVSRIFMCFVVMIIFVVVALGLNAFDTFIFPRFPPVFPCYKFSSLI